MFGGNGGFGGPSGGQPQFNMFFGGPGGPHGPETGGQFPQGFNPMQMLFNNFGGDNPGNVDQTLLNNLFGPGGAAGMAGGNFTQGGFSPADFGFPAGPPGGTPGAAAGGPANHSHPPTSAAMMRQLPRVKVTRHDLAANESNECSICLDELVLGQPALRIPCGHLYHEDCVRDWLKKSNECPVCRYELPTDDAEFERGRRERMAGRKLRMRRADLTVKTAQELRKLCDFIGVDVKGCLEKVEFVDCIAAHPKVEIIPEATDGEGGGEAACNNATPSADSSNSTFRQFSEEVRSTPTPMRTDEQACSSSSSPSFSAPQAAAATAPTTPLGGKSVAQLKQLARQLGVSLDGCLEKGDILQRIREAPGYREGTS